MFLSPLSVTIKSKQASDEYSLRSFRLIFYSTSIALTPFSGRRSLQRFQLFIIESNKDHVYVLGIAGQMRQKEYSGCVLGLLLVLLV